MSSKKIKPGEKMIKETKSKKNQNYAKEMSKVTKEEWRDYTKTVWSIANTSHPLHPAVFPKEIPSRLIKLFSFWGEKILDPFAGTGVTGAAALELGRSTVCIDQNPNYIKEIKRNLSKTTLPNEEATFEVIHTDSRNLKLQDDSIDLIITSPPYWDKADYGKSKKNLGAIKSYKEFLDEIKPVFSECYRTLKPGRKMCIVTANVNQYTEHGLLSFPLAADFTFIMREVGFLVLSEIIWSKDGTGGRWGSYGKQRPIFGSYPYPPNFLFKTLHEHILVFIKPPLERKKGEKVKLLKDIMRPGKNKR